MYSLQLIWFLFILGGTVTYFNIFMKILAKKNETLYNKKLQNFMRYQSVQRQMILRGYLNQNMSAITQFGSFYNALVPEIICPWLARVGNVDDGGKWICNPWALTKNCVIYSLGVGPDISFEIEMDKITEKQCKIYSADPNPTFGKGLVDLNSNRFNFIKGKISKETNKKFDEYSLTDIKNLYKHTWIDILKIDVEGNNFKIDYTSKDQNCSL